MRSPRRPHLLCWLPNLTTPRPSLPECQAVAGSPDAAVSLGSQQSQASPEQGAQGSPEDHQRGSPVLRKRKKRVGCLRREPGDDDPTKHSRKSRCQEEEGDEGPVRRGAALLHWTCWWNHLAQGHCRGTLVETAHDRRQTRPRGTNDLGPSVQQIEQPGPRSSGLLDQRRFLVHLSAYTRAAGQGKAKPIIHDLTGDEPLRSPPAARSCHSEGSARRSVVRIEEEGAVDPPSADVCGEDSERR